MRVKNLSASPLIYGDGKTIDPYEWSEGESEEFKNLVENTPFLIYVEEIPSSKPNEIEEIIEDIEVFPTNKPKKTTSIKPMIDTTVAKES